MISPNISSRHSLHKARCHTTLEITASGTQKNPGTLIDKLLQFLQHFESLVLLLTLKQLRLDDYTDIAPVQAPGGDCLAQLGAFITRQSSFFCFPSSTGGEGHCIHLNPQDLTSNRQGRVTVRHAEPKQPNGGVACRGSKAHRAYYLRNNSTPNISLLSRLLMDGASIPSIGIPIDKEKLWQLLMSIASFIQDVGVIEQQQRDAEER